MNIPLLPGLIINTSNAALDGIKRYGDDMDLTKFKEDQDEYAKEVLIERNMRLVAHIAKKYNTTECEIAELNDLKLEEPLKAGKCLILEKKVEMCN